MGAPNFARDDGHDELVRESGEEEGADHGLRAAEAEGGDEGCVNVAQEEVVHGLVPFARELVLRGRVPLTRLSDTAKAKLTSHVPSLHKTRGPRS